MVFDKKYIYTTRVLDSHDYNEDMKYMIESNNTQ